MKRKWTVIQACAAFVVILIIMALASIAYAQASFTGGTYTQDFDSLASSGTSSAVPTGWAFSESGTSTKNDGKYTANNGSNDDGDTYSYGATGDADRAFGELTSGTLQSTIGVQFQNNTGKTIGELTISCICEQWRYGGSTSGPDRMDFQYSTNATSLTDGSATWVDVNTLDCSSKVTSGTTGPLDGNASANRTALSATIAGLNISNGSTFWFRWLPNNISGFDDGLAIDDFSMSGKTPNAITLRTLTAITVPLSPLPAALPVLGLITLGGLAAVAALGIGAVLVRWRRG
jgi:hypothetical protein